MEADDAPPAVDNVPVCFFTTTFPGAVVPPDQVFAVPLTTLPEGLSALVNELLDRDPHVPMDFLVGDDYITTTLEKFMRRRRLTVEDTLRIEYTPAMQAQEGSKLPHDDWVSSVVAPVHGIPTLLLTGAYDNCIRMWNGDDCVAIGTGHTAAVKEVRLHPVKPSNVDTTAAPTSAKKVGRKSKRGTADEMDSFNCVSVGKDGCINSWLFNAHTSKFDLLTTTMQHGDAVDTVDVHPSGDWVATGSWDSNVKLFRWEELIAPPAEAVARAAVASVAKGAAATYSFTDHARPVLKVRFSPANQSRLYSTGLDGSVKVWDLERGALVSTLAGDHAAHCMAVKPGTEANGGTDMIITGHTDNRLRLFDPRAKNIAKVWTGHRQWVYGVAWQWHKEEAPVAQPLIVSSSEDATLRVWDLRATNAPLLTLDVLHTDGILDVTYVGNNEVASCGKDNRTKTMTLKSAA